MKKLIIFLGGIFFSTTNIHSSYSQDIKTGAQRLKNGHLELKALLPKLKNMYKELEINVVRASDGVKRSNEGFVESQKSKNDILQQLIPHRLKNKIVTALTNLEEVLPIVSKTLITLKNNIDSNIARKHDNLSSIDSKLTKIDTYMEGTNSVPIRLERVAKYIEKGEKAKASIEGIKERIINMLKKFYKGNQ